MTIPAVGIIDDKPATVGQLLYLYGLRINAWSLKQNIPALRIRRIGSGATQRRCTVGRNWGRRSAATSTPAEILLKAADGSLQARHELAAELIDALLERATTLSDTERIAYLVECTKNG